MKKIENKIKLVEELKKILEQKKNKSKKICMCHGVFDIVHPGHIRHLVYTKKRADILVASLTADVHITKGNIRPYIPQDLRAYNLAMLECVDYVIIDKNPDPVKNLSILKPDYYAKGYEYKNYQNEKTQIEKKILDKFGGKFIFTPSDVVYSSSKIINEEKPNLAIEKLFSFMKKEKISFEGLVDIVKNKKIKKKILVVGDIIIDSYLETDLIGGQTKTPTLSLKEKNTVSVLGGAGIVCKHLSKAGSEVEFLSVLGTGKLKSFVKKELRKENIRFTYINDPNRPITEKKNVVCKGYNIVKIDTVDNSPINDEIINFIKKHIKSSHYNCIIFSDFRHGIFNSSSIPIFTDAIKKNKFKVADSQVASRWGNILDFKNFDLITPNEKEARFSLSDQDSVIRPLALKLYRKSKAKYLILKLGDKGLVTYRNKNPNNFRGFFFIDSLVENLIDAVGAGDSLLAYSVISFLKSKNIVASSIIGAIAASIECEKSTNQPVLSDEVIKRIYKIENKLKYE